MVLIDSVHISDIWSYFTLDVKRMKAVIGANDIVFLDYICD